MTQTLAEQSVAIAEEPPSTEGPDPLLPTESIVPSAEAQRVVAATVASACACTKDCAYCVFANRFETLQRAADIEAAAKNQQDLNHRKHITNGMKRDSKNEMVKTVIAAGNVLETKAKKHQRRRDAKKLFETCHHKLRAVFGSDAEHILDVTVPSKIDNDVI